MRTDEGDCALSENERSNVVRKAREFFYVDLERVRSYYAQLNRGVVETVMFRDTGELVENWRLR